MSSASPVALPARACGTVRSGADADARGSVVAAACIAVQGVGGTDAGAAACRAAADVGAGVTA